MGSYQSFAKHYDLLMRDCDYEQWSQFLIEELSINGIRNSSKGLDLACGTGMITERLSESGFCMIGIDNSPEMLNIAEERKRKKSNPIYVLQDISSFLISGQVDFVTCICDGVNYLSPTKVKMMFDNVYMTLKSGGVLIFDISSEFKLKEIISNNVFVCDDEVVSYIWTNKLLKDKVVMSLTFFEKSAELYNRFGEEHVQYIYSEAYLKALLLSTGFSSVKTFDGYKKKITGSKSKRILFEVVK